MRGRTLVVVAALVGLPVAGPLPTARAENEICVAVVVDYQQLDGAPAQPSRHCAKVPNRSSGYEILLERARALGRPDPRSENGLICAIDGWPERGCGDSAGGGYRYWAYFHRTGDGPWQYSNRGAADYRVIDDPSTSADDRPSEGWVWVDGGAEGTVRPAAIPYDDICPPDPATPRPTPRDVAASPTPSARSSSPAPRPSRSPASTRTADAPTADGRTGPPASPSTTTAAQRGSAAPAAARASAAPTPSDPQPIDVTTLPEDRGAGSGGVPVSTVAGVGIVALLAGVAAVRLRRSDRG